MADVNSMPSSTEPVVQDDLEDMKKSLEGYRQLLLPLTRVLEWEQPYFPGVLFGVTTFVFALVWYWEPSVLTAFSLLGLLLCAVDFLIPIVTPMIFRNAEWTGVQEQQFESICTRVLHARSHAYSLVDYLSKLKAEKPKMYLSIMMGVFGVLAWIGSLLDNMLLTYLLVLFLVMVPGLRKHGILQRVTDQIKEKAKGLLNKKEAAGKKKD